MNPSDDERGCATPRPMRTLSAAMLTLVPQAAAHAPQMFAVLADPALYRYENEPPPSVEWLRERFARLEARQSPDGRDQWLNWVIQLPGGELIGYVQATVRPGGRAAVAYVLASAHWGRGLAHCAVEAMIGELVERYGVHALSAVLKRGNLRSLRLLQRLGFVAGSAQQHAQHEAGADELLMLRNLGEG